MDLYSAFLTTAPFILLAISGGVTFGPVPAAARHRAWRISWWWLLNDLGAVLIVIVGAALSLRVLGDVVQAGPTARLAAVASGVLALFLLLLLAGVVCRLHREAQAPAPVPPGTQVP